MKKVRWAELKERAAIQNLRRRYHNGHDPSADNEALLSLSCSAKSGPLRPQRRLITLSSPR
jgi:hypothetical protein